MVAWEYVKGVTMAAHSGGSLHDIQKRRNVSWGGGIYYSYMVVVVE
jgi:hypothetical protein